jgi:hypothetical protein
MELVVEFTSLEVNDIENGGYLNKINCANWKGNAGWASNGAYFNLLVKCLTIFLGENYEKTTLVKSTFVKHKATPIH